MSGDLLLGIDIGTSVVKAALFDQTGREVAAAARRTTLHVPHPGWSETSMDETWLTAAAVLRNLLQQSAVENTRIAAVGVSGNMIGAWLIDPHGEPVRPAILWNDGRSHALLEELCQGQPDFLSSVFQSSGSVLEYGSTLLLLRWLAEMEPASLERTAAILHSKDWIRYKLTGEIHTDISEVPGTPGDVGTRTYSDAMFSAFDLIAYSRLFPPFVPSETVVGTVLPDAANLTGLAAGTPVVAGAGDVPAVVLGVGAVKPGMACSILGTHSINGIILDQPSFEPPDAGLLFTIPEQRWMRALTNVAGTSNLDWFINQFCQLESASSASSTELFNSLENLLAKSPPGAHGVLYHPYLSAVGIIAPFSEPTARAQFLGLTREHGKHDLLRAVYEGVALAIRDCYSAMNADMEEIRLSGGGARSGVWGQIIADCVGKPVVIPAGNEFGAKGAALLAGVGIGRFSSIADAASQTLQIDRVYTPNTSLKPLYDENFALYTALRNTLRPLWQQAAARKFLKN